jgi:hypothetical protein
VSKIQLSLSIQIIEVIPSQPSGCNTASSFGILVYRTPTLVSCEFYLTARFAVDGKRGIIFLPLKIGQ